MDTKLTISEGSFERKSIGMCFYSGDAKKALNLILKSNPLPSTGSSGSFFPIMASGSSLKLELCKNNSEELMVDECDFDKEHALVEFGEAISIKKDTELHFIVRAYGDGTPDTVTLKTVTGEPVEITKNIVWERD